MTLRDVLSLRGGGVEQVQDGVCAGKVHSSPHSPLQKLGSSVRMSKNLFWQKVLSKATSLLRFSQECFLGRGLHSFWGVSAGTSRPCCSRGILNKLF